LAVSATIVTEGQLDEALISSLLRSHPTLRDLSIRVRAAGGRSAAQSKARTILTERREPVALVVDADTVEPRAVQQQRGFLEARLEQASPSEEWRVILLVPEIEILFFEDEKILQALVPQKPSPEDLIRARYEPRRVLERLLAKAGGRASLEASLRLGVDLEPLWRLEALRPLEEFLLQKLVHSMSSSRRKVLDRRRL
jgi:hypothetical protein